MKDLRLPSTGALIASALLLLMIAGCEDTVSDGSSSTSPDGSAKAEVAEMEYALNQVAQNPDKLVITGESIQAAIDAVPAGGAVVVRPGIYRESITIDKPNITLIGLPGGDGVIIENPDGAENGVDVTENGDGVKLFNFTTRAFLRNGVFMSGVEDFLMLKLHAEDNGDYGLFPVRSSGKMLMCSASGHRDAGLYIGQSSNVQILLSYVTENVIGIEVSNSSNVVVRHNLAENNTIGILGVLLPPTRFRTVLTSNNVVIADNVVRDNNHPNFASPDELPAFVPSGSGILVVGLDNATVQRNTVTDNNWVGIGLGSTATFGLLAGIEIEGIEPDPQGVIIRRNTVTGNGANPPPPPFPLPGVDLLWDGTGYGNCWVRNTFDTSVPPTLPSC